MARRYGIAAKRRFGQNFIFDLNLTRRIAAAAGPLAATAVVEIGAGLGGLTRALLAAGAREVVAVERDRRCLAALADIARHYPGRLRIHEGDALELDPAALAAAPRKIVANLPYNIATPLLIGWLDRLPEFESLTLMFQREVALRLVAAPGGKAYGRLGVLVQWRARTRLLFDVPAAAFVPAPKVTSSVVAIVPRTAPVAADPLFADPLFADRAVLERVTAAAFGRRRKMLRSSLRTLGLAVGPLCEAAGVAPTARAEELSVAEFCALARAVAAASSAPGPIDRPLPIIEDRPMQREIVTIAGSPGSGKSSTAKALAAALGFRHFSSGDRFRELAALRGESIEATNVAAEVQREIDLEVDRQLQEMGRQDDRIVIDSRMAWRWMPHSFKVYLALDPDRAAARVFGQVCREGRLSEEARSVAEMRDSIARRFASEKKRYEALYGVDFTDPLNFDIVVNTRDNDLGAVTAIVAAAFRAWRGTAGH